LAVAQRVERWLTLGAQQASIACGAGIRKSRSFSLAAPRWCRNGRAPKGSPGARARPASPPRLAGPGRGLDGGHRGGSEAGSAHPPDAGPARARRGHVPSAPRRAGESVGAARHPDAGRERGERLGATPLGLRTPGPGQLPVVVAAELEPVRFILSRRRAGAAFRTIAAELTVQGFQTKRGGRWYASTVQAVWEARRCYALT
jgi:hypothetical protein